MSRSATAAGKTVTGKELVEGAARAQYRERGRSHALTLHHLEILVEGVVLVPRIAREVDPGDRGARMHVVDSFEVLSEPKKEDAVGGRFVNTRGAMACPL